MSLLKAQGLFIYTLGAITVLLAPIAVLIVFSFDADPFPSLPWRGSTLSWYYGVFTDQDLLGSVGLGLRLALATAVTSLMIGSSAALSLLRLQQRKAILLVTVFSLPLLVPAMMLGLAARMFFNYVHLSNPLLRVWIIHTLVFSPIVLSLLYSRLDGFARHLELVAQDLGARSFQIIWRILIPLSWPSACAAGLLVLALCLDEFTLAWMLLNLQPTLPVRVWGMMEASISPEINALGILTLLGSMVLYALSLYLIRIGMHAYPGVSSDGAD